ncbi:hypothetical protein C7N43_07765 [Sphingobacteriales bacterium UPWRP_1]|nr:hypothetical protein B6N25_09085 [Sphingobacteriales bacterium TSM_CSS]PSJ77653.1 hypothetical protein C7N43_07765 [Sphingobacteriales bacterium UPWRP_1]
MQKANSRTLPAVLPAGSMGNTGKAGCLPAFYAQIEAKKLVITVFVILFVQLLPITSVFCYFCVNSVKIYIAAG